MMDEVYGKVTMYWVERNGKLASRFGNIYYANIRAMKLSAGTPAHGHGHRPH